MHVMFWVSGGCDVANIKSMGPMYTHPSDTVRLHLLIANLFFVVTGGDCQSWANSRTYCYSE
jgi:hypothetical protein